MKKFLVLAIILGLGTIVFCYENNNTDNSNVSETKSVEDEYLNWSDDPSQAVYNAEQESYVEQNYGSTSSMEYLNRADSDEYSGGSDFARNY